MYYRRNCCNTLDPNDFPVTGCLIQEHQLLENLLQGYGQAIVNKNLDHIKNFSNYMLKEFIPLHYAKEEQLFLIASKQLPTGDLQLPKLVQDHTNERLHFLQLLEMIEYGAPWEELKQAAGTLCDDIGVHMEEETKIIFPLVEGILTSQQAYLAQTRMAKIGYVC